jgi:hypothetical protein
MTVKMKVSLMKLAVLRALTVLLIFPAVSQHAWSEISEIEALVKRHGFEFRPKEETPWGVAQVNEGRFLDRRE